MIGRRRREHDARKALFLGHVSPLMAESCGNIAGSQVGPSLRQILITGPGNANPGEVVLTPTDAEVTAAEELLVDLAARLLDRRVTELYPNGPRGT